MAETRKFIMKIGGDDASAIRARKDIISFYEKNLILLKNEEKFFFLGLLRKLGQDISKQYYIDADANLFEIIEEQKTN